MQRLAAASANNRVDSARAEIEAESGLQSALSVLAIQSTTATSQNDPWYSLGDYGQDRFLTDSGSFRMQVIDAASLVNLNGATQTQLQNLPLTQAQVDSLLDWQQTGATPRADGAKDSYYNSLQNPYNTSEAALHSVDELLLVANFTPATLFTVQQGVNNITPPETTVGNVTYQPVLYDLVTVDSANPTGGTQTNANSASLTQLQGLLGPALGRTVYNARPFTSLGNLFTKVPTINLTNAATILNSLTVTQTTGTGTGTGTGTRAPASAALPPIKVDVNTASQAVLQTIPGVTSDIAQGFVSRQANTGITSLGQITQVPGMSMAILRQSADSFTINSQSFIVRVIGTAGSISVPLEAVITLSNSTASITKVYHPPFNNMTSHWHWDNQSSNDIDLRAAS
jgi:DNA uptake protein ComE-like DNA-binding protein